MAKFVSHFLMLRLWWMEGSSRGKMLDIAITLGLRTIDELTITTIL